MLPRLRADVPPILTLPAVYFRANNGHSRSAAENLRHASPRIRKVLSDFKGTNNIGRFSKIIESTSNLIACVSIRYPCIEADIAQHSAQQSIAATIIQYARAFRHTQQPSGNIDHAKIVNASQEDPSIRVCYAPTSISFLKPVGRLCLQRTAGPAKLILAGVFSQHNIRKVDLCRSATQPARLRCVHSISVHIGRLTGFGRLAETYARCDHLLGFRSRVHAEPPQSLKSDPFIRRRGSTFRQDENRPVTPSRPVHEILAQNAVLSL